MKGRQPKKSRIDIFELQVNPSQQQCHLSNRKEADLAAHWDIAFLCDLATTTLYIYMVNRICSHLLICANKKQKIALQH